MGGYERVNFSEVFLGPFIGFGIFTLFIFMIDINYVIVNNPVTDPSLLFRILVSGEMISLVLFLVGVGVILSFVIGVAIIYPILKFLASDEKGSLVMGLKRFNFVYGYEAVLYIIIMNIISGHLSSIAPPIYEPVYIPSNVTGSSLSLWFLIGLMIGFFFSRVLLFVLFTISKKRYEIRAYKSKAESKVILEKNTLSSIVV